MSRRGDALKPTKRLFLERKVKKAKRYLRDREESWRSESNTVGVISFDSAV